jgi:exopolysaccharide biosynthesis operon protein EpsL
MRTRVVFPIGRLLALLVALSPFSLSHAALDKFDPYAYARVRYDSNLFRRNSNEQSETIGYLGAGVNADLKLSRQHLLLDAVVARAEYDSYDQLDHTRIDGTGTWAWQVGNLWSGNLGYRYQDQLTSFNERLVTDKDMRTTQTGFLDAGYQIHPDWRLVAGAELRDVSYQERKRLERDASQGSLEVQYRNTLNTRVGVRGRYTKNDLKDENIGGIRIDNDYDETEISGVFYWEGTAKSALEARLGFVDVSYNDLDDRDFKGVSYRAIYHWVHSEKTKVDIEAWRETSSLSDEITEYVLTQGISISPSWSVTHKISLQGKLLYNNDDFKARNDIITALGGQRRDDDTWLFRVTANWDPRKYLRLSVGYTREDRDSSIDARDFDTDQVEGKVLFRF